MKIQPINHYTVVKLDPSDEKVGSTKKLYAPGVMKSEFALPKRSGTVIATGRGLVTASGAIVPPQVKAGDRIWVTDLSGVGGKPFLEFDYNGEKCVVLPGEELILGIITEEEPVKSALEA